jgi:hypothetical protein
VAKLDKRADIVRIDEDGLFKLIETSELSATERRKLLEEQRKKEASEKKRLGIVFFPVCLFVYVFVCLFVCFICLCVCLYVCYA